MKTYRINDICEINPKTAIELNYHDYISFIPMNAVSVDGKIDTTNKIIPAGCIKNYSVFQEGDILFAKITPCMENGKGCIADKLKNGYGAGSTEFIVLRSKQELVIQKWLHLFLSQKVFRLYCQQHMTGSAGQRRVPPKFLANCMIPIPSLSEQKRIVDRIEELFSQLDASVAELKTTKERLKVYRQAVLKEAFLKFDGSIEKTISSVCENIVDCPHSTPKWAHKGKLCLRTTNFKPGYLDLSEKNYVSEETFCERISRLAPKPGDVLFSREGAILGIACIIPDGLEVCMGQRMMLLRPSKDLLNKYLMYYLNSPKARTLIIENVGGTASPHINVGDIKQFTIPIIPFAQQQSVVAKIESRLSICNSIEKTVDTALRQAEALRQSILKKAFEGGL